TMEPGIAVSALPGTTGCSRRRARTARVLRRLLAVLAYPEDVRDAEVARILATLPPDVTPRAAVRSYRARLDRWLEQVVARLDLGIAVNAVTRRAALLALEPGRNWPQALFAAEPPPAFLAALKRALPV